MFSGCRPSQNIFLEEGWQVIKPDNSLAEIIAQPTEEEPALKKRRGS